MAKIIWKNDGWNTVQEVDAAKHLLGISARTENGMVVEVRIQHNDGEESTSNVKLAGKPALPLSTEQFQKFFEINELVFE